MFNSALFEVTKILRNDSFMRFVNSQEYQEMMSKPKKKASLRGQTMSSKERKLSSFNIKQLTSFVQKTHTVSTSLDIQKLERNGEKDNLPITYNVISTMEPPIAITSKFQEPEGLKSDFF